MKKLNPGVLWEYSHFRGVRVGCEKYQAMTVLLHDMNYYKNAIEELNKQRLENIGRAMLISALDGKPLSKLGHQLRKFKRKNKLK